MYSGTTLKQLRNLDRWFGAHQKIDRLARRHVELLASGKMTMQLPSISEILRFEGLDGPDAIKRKTPAQDEPWHYYDPHDSSDTQLLDIIEAHYSHLVETLRESNETRASFEAAWMAHAIVDGLTPAHHYPYEEELKRLRKGAGIESRTTPKEKLMMPGDTVREKVKNNWQMWGDKGLLATHIAFEAGVALLIIPMRYQRLKLFEKPPKITGQKPYLSFFKSQAKKIAAQAYYDDFYSHGWTPKLAKKVRRELVPDMVDTVAYVWYSALKDAQKEKKR
jgi:hypothetical protein